MRYREVLHSVIIHDLDISFGDKTPIKNFSCSISSGEKIALMGASGAGKSTLLSAILGLVTISCGEMDICGVKTTVEGFDKIRGSVSWLPQMLELPIDIVQELFDMHFALRVNSHLKFRRESCEELLDRVGLSGDILSREWSSLSGGERQRVLIVCSVMLSRPIILLDEPTSALDATSSRKVGALLSSLDDVTIIAATHDKVLLESFDRVINL